MSASNRSRAAQPARDLDRTLLGLALGQTLTAYALAHPPDVHLDADAVGVVDLGRDRGRGVAADARKLREVVGPAVARDLLRPLPTATGPVADSRAGPTR